MTEKWTLNRVVTFCELANNFRELTGNAGVIIAQNYINLEKPLKLFNVQRDALVRKYDPEGKGLDQKNEKWRDYVTEINDLLLREVEVDIERLPKDTKMTDLQCASARMVDLIGMYDFLVDKGDSDAKEAEKTDSEDTESGK